LTTSPQTGKPRITMIRPANVTISPKSLVIGGEPFDETNLLPVAI
jgi:hypothetical protein